MNAFQIDYTEGYSHFGSTKKSGKMEDLAEVIFSLLPLAVIVMRVKKSEPATHATISFEKLKPIELALTALIHYCMTNFENDLAHSNLLDVFGENPDLFQAALLISNRGVFELNGAMSSVEFILMYVLEHGIPKNVLSDPAYTDKLSPFIDVAQFNA